MIVCSECGKSYKNEKAIRSHTWRTHTTQGLVHGSKTGGHNKGQPSTRRGKTKYTCENIARITERMTATIRQKVKDGTRLPPIMGDLARQRLSERQSTNNSGGRSKWFDYKGSKLQGTWEYNLAQKFDEFNIKWCKLKLRKDILKYSINNTQKSYTPDFYLEEYNVYVEVKGYWWGNDKEKMDAVLSQHPEKKFLIIELNQYKEIMKDNLDCIWDLKLI